MLTVPPAPGISPMPASGSANVVSGAAVTMAAKAGSSTPAPTQGPCTRTSARSLTACSSSAAPAWVRTKCAVTGSGAVPNSPRSPPELKHGPAPSMTTLVTDGSSSATRRASASASRSWRP
jgi:hypothetical protein